MENKKETTEKTMNAKAMLKENARKKTVIKYGERVKLKVVAKTKFYNVGQIITPHKVMGEQLVKDGIAEVVKD